MVHIDLLIKKNLNQFIAYCFIHLKLQTLLITITGTLQEKSPLNFHRKLEPFPQPDGEHARYAFPSLNNMYQIYKADRSLERT